LLSIDCSRGQLSLEALVAIAVFLGFLAVLMGAAIEFSEKSRAAGVEISKEQRKAGALLSYEVERVNGVWFSENQEEAEMNAWVDNHH